MATIVFFHAHPDDECIGSGGTMAKAAVDGHRVVLVVATRGEHGEVVAGVVVSGGQLGIHRVAETFASAEVLGVQRIEFLGYIDSGMIGTPENDAPYSFWGADVDDAASRLAAILRDEEADVLVAYDPNGNYGHPDHIQVHRVGYRAAELAGTPRVYEMTINRDRMIEAFLARRDTATAEELEQLPEIDPDSFQMGMPDAEITHSIDVQALTATKRAAMRCHASQIGEDHFFLTLSDDDFALAFGTEWFIDRSRPRGAGEAYLTDLFT
ncbi:MAG: PIG-L family deacetylase [Microthrixaceae bacterium]